MLLKMLLYIKQTLPQIDILKKYMIQNPFLKMTLKIDKSITAFNEILLENTFFILFNEIKMKIMYYWKMKIY